MKELKEFMDEIVKANPEVRGKYICSPEDFTRNRDLPFSTVVLMILNLMKRSLSIEIHSFFSYLGHLTSVTKAAFCMQRAKLQPEFFAAWNKVLVDSFYKNYGENAKRWHGFILMAIDGTTLSLPNTKALRALYGSSGNQHGEQGVTARSSVLYDVLNGLVISGSLDHYTTPERSTAIRFLQNVPQDSLLLLDRGYPCFALLYLLTHVNKRHFVMRVKSSFSKQIQAFAESAQTDCQIEITATSGGIGRLKEEGIAIDSSASVEVRLAKVKLDNGEEEILMTSLYDPNQYPLADLKEVYFMRWGIETYYGFEKNELQIENFSGIRPLCILQDFFANLFVYNLQSIIEKQSEPYLEAVSKKRNYHYKINKNVSFAMLKDRMVELFLERKEPADILMELQALFEQNLEPVRPGRKYPRIKKVRKVNGKYITLTNYKRAI
ncbi:hypothetical protein AGMMS4957_22230 [Bacteroidia bacterium]|nr:hypothetical protein AGMMS4957_22230 [Bacteroidia bacterium]